MRNGKAVNDINLYQSAREQMQPGDGIFFYGNAPISHIIETVAGGPSHVAIVQEAMTGFADVLITQSTIEGELNGVQSEYLGWTLANYGVGARAEWTPLLPIVREKANWAAFYKCIAASTGRVHYDRTGLVLYALHDIFPHLPKPPDKGYEMFCSAWATVLGQAAEIIDPSIAYRDVSPDALRKMPLWGTGVKIL